MADLLGIGSSALLAYSNALSVTSNNIANANTPGYSRERANLQALTGITTTAGSIGTGVQVQSVQRLTSSYLQTQLVSVGSSYSRISTLQGYASQLDSLLSDSSSGLSQPLQTFFTDLNSLAANPSSSATRQTLLTDAQSLASTFNGLQSQIDGMSQQLDSAVGSTVTQVNGYASQLAQLNMQISQASGSGQSSATLLDQRDQLLQNLGNDIGISSVTNADGSVNVYVANGQPLVLGTSANTLSVQPNTYGSGQDIVLNSPGSKTVITSQVSGGSIGGVLDFQREMLVPASDQLGQLALGLASAVNAQNAQGMDQYGQLGGNFFSTPTVPAISASTNTGSGSVAANVANVSQLSGADQVLSYDGSTWTMTDATTGAQTALSGAGTTASPLTGGGLSLVISGTPAAGDRYLIQPARDAAAGLQVAITDSGRIAAAAPLQTSTAGTNTGSGAIGGVSVTDASNPNLLSATAIQFTSATTYSINGAGSYSFTAGSPIAVNGWQVSISGTPAAGDQFTVSANAAGSGDNSNALKLAAIINQKLLNGGTGSIATANAAMISTVGAQAQQASAQLSAQTAIQTQVQNAASSVSGVNLDEEASDMMRFQQAYQAAAQVIAASSTIFQSLLSALNS